MAQGIFNHLNNNQKAEIKNIHFQKGSSQPSPTGDTLKIYGQFNGMQDELDFAPFSNLRKIIFEDYTRFNNNLDSINLSKNEKLRKIVIKAHDPFDSFLDYTFILLVKEIQVNKIVVLCQKYRYYSEELNEWNYVGKHLREQAIIPYSLVEEKKTRTIRGRSCEPSTNTYT